MPNLTLSIPVELHRKMKKHSEIRWSEVVRKTIAERIEDLELMDRLARNSRLTKKDVEDISHKIKRDIYKEMTNE
ncbi:MAG: hypothetical protein HY367_03330 [Candidatus Aenigmarchaeota archaeon]|nr:hypothetical protein [Candidatus Aenigmarchaeota archaeon]